MQSDRSSNWYDVVVLSFVLDGDNATWARFFFSAMHKNFDDEASFSNHIIANLVIMPFRSLFVSSGRVLSYWLSVWGVKCVSSVLHRGQRLSSFLSWCDCCDQSEMFVPQQFVISELLIGRYWI